jgi:hypothetical protein
MLGCYQICELQISASYVLLKTTFMPKHCRPLTGVSTNFSERNWIFVDSDTRLACPELRCQLLSLLEYRVLLS